MTNLISEPFVGRSFELGVRDCYSLCVSFYKENFDIDMPPIARPRDWEADKIDLISNFYKMCGLEKVDAEENWPPRPADMLAVTLGGRTPNHLLVYLGENKLLHHPVQQLSKIEMMRPVWRRFTSFILRHPSVPDLTPQKPTAFLEDILNEKFI